METAYREELLKACGILFGPNVDLSVDFLSYIQPSGIKSAYRRKALMTHPDRVAHLGEKAYGRGAEFFMETRWAYERLLGFIKTRDNGHGSGSLRPRQSKQGTSRADRESYYRGSMPMRTMLLGQYLFYAGEIPLDALIKAIVWQRGQRPMLGELAVKRGWLTHHGLLHAIKNRNLSELIGGALVRLNLLTTVQIKTLLYSQRMRQRPFGEFFVLNNYLTMTRLNQMINEFILHNQRHENHARRRDGEAAH